MTTILIVDDEEAIRLAFEAVLTRAGYTVHTTPSPEEALRLLDAHQPQLVLLDLNLGSAAETTGLDLIRILHAHLPTLLVVVVSGYLNTAPRAAALAAGAVDCWAKPLTMAALRERVAEVLQTKTGIGAPASERATGGVDGLTV